MATAISKHQRYTPDGDWIPGKLRILANPSLRKLMRAATHGKMPDERQVIIDHAMDQAAKRGALYLNSCPAKRQARVSVEAEKLRKKLAEAAE